MAKDAITLEYVPVTFVRHKLDAPPALAVFGPKESDHASAGAICLACGEPMQPGDHTTLIPLGPGADPEARERCRDRRWFNAVALEVHHACATGSVLQPVESQIAGEAP